MASTYPPASHVLRDLRLSFQHNVDLRTSHAWLPVVPEICDARGTVSAGALATLVDVLGGGLAAVAADPNWIATADLTLHVVGAAPAGTEVEARGRVLRAGRTTVVLEVDLFEGARQVGIATMSFTVLPRRDINPDVSESRSGDRHSMASADSRLSRPLGGVLGIEVLDRVTGTLEMPITPWTHNSMGAVQGGVVAMLIEAAGATALSSPIDELQIAYVGFGKVGPVRTRVAPVASKLARVEIIDAGADGRLMALATVRAS